MNNGKLIKNYFDFLLDYGFKRKQFSNGTDYEVIYEKPIVKIGIFYVASISNKLGEKLVKDSNSPKTFDKEKYIKSIMEAPLIYAIDVIIAKNDNHTNLLQCLLFDAIQLQRLSEAIKSCGSDYQKQLEIYSKFIKDNISKII